MTTITIAELVEGRAATTLTGDRPIWQDGTGRAFAVASGACGDWVPEQCQAQADPAAPIPQAADATPDAPLIWVHGMSGQAALVAMGLVRLEADEG